MGEDPGRNNGYPSSAAQPGTQIRQIYNLIISSNIIPPYPANILCSDL